MIWSHVKQGNRFIYVTCFIIINQLVLWDPAVGNYYSISRRQGSISNPNHSGLWHQAKIVRSCSQQYCLHDTTPRYLQDVIQPVAVTSRRRLRSISSSAQAVPVTRRTTIGDRPCAVAGPRAWNSLPQFVIDCSSPGTFRKYLKTHLFSLSF